MKKPSALTKEDFETLLASLSTDRAKAGEKYEEIRLGLIRFFRYRGCVNPQTLTDETFNRAASKISGFNPADRDQIIRFFYGFAKKIFLEYVSRDADREVSLETRSYYLSSEETEQENLKREIEAVCLEKCLNEISPENKKLILEYYSYNKSKKVVERLRLAEQLNLKKGALHTKVFRLRNILKKCMEKCMEKKNM